jgi:SAM-dependent methyltransferase
MMEHLIVRLIGWRATLLHGDPCVYDRWRWLKRHLRGGALRTLDAGCGSGAFAMYAAMIGNEAVGVTLGAREVDVARVRARMLGLSRASFVQADLRELDRLGSSLGTFDQIMCLETMEHIRADAKLVRDLAALLRPGGRLLVTTPYKHYRRLIGDRLSDTEDGGHVRWGYTHDEMRQLFVQCGLEPVALETTSGVISQQLTNLQRVCSRVHVRVAWAATLPLRVLQPLDAFLSRWLEYPPLSIAVVGVKR